MSNIVLTPEELFFLARKMKAKYLDYEYLSLMGDIQNDAEAKEMKALESLTNKDYIDEDFEGNIEIADYVACILNPVFFGKIESLIKKNEIIKLHIIDDCISECRIANNELSLRNINDVDLSEIISGDLELQCANTEKGTYIQRYTALQLQDASIKSEVIKIAKGEW